MIDEFREDDILSFLLFCVREPRYLGGTALICVEFRKLTTTETSFFMCIYRFKYIKWVRTNIGPYFVIFLCHAAVS